MLINNQEYSTFVNDFSELIKDFDSVCRRNLYNRLYKNVVEIVEKSLIEKVLGLTEGNQLKAAKMLGINRNTLSAKMRRLKVRRFT